MNPLDKAFSETQRSYFASKATVASLTSELLVNPRSRGSVVRSDMSVAAEQLKHFTGWVYASVRPIAQKIAAQRVHVGRKRRGGEPRELGSHEILDLLADPSELLTGWSLMFTTVASLELTGICLWWIQEQQGKRRVYAIPSSWIVGHNRYVIL